MKAAVLHALGTPLAIENLPDPVLGTGEIIVDVIAAGVLPYAAEVLSGARRYLFDLPIVPGAGAVGRVRAIGPDATRLRPGDWVIVDPTVRSRDDACTPDITLQGLSARGPGGLHLARHFHDGSWAQQVRVPTENAYPLGAIDAADAGRWTVLNLLLVPYGGLRAVALQAGEAVLVSGATGNFGSAAVAVALAMGAARVVAPGRNVAMLTELERRFGPRVVTVVLTGDAPTDTAAMQAAAGGPIDVVIDLLPPDAGVAPVRAAAMAVREYGRIVLMGGVGMLGGDDLALPYPWIMRNNITVRGQWLCQRAEIPAMIALVRAGLIDLRQFEVAEFALDDVNAAVAHAAAHGGAFHSTVVRPDLDSDT
jgi:alcohol dehydrogenase